jgi:cell division protein YceG involved in septum cleavage
MSIVMSWVLFAIFVLMLGVLSYKATMSLPSAYGKYVKIREGIKREKLMTEKLRQQVLNEQLKSIKKDK